MATCKEARMRVNLGMLTRVFNLPIGVRIVGVEAVIDFGAINQIDLVLSGDSLPDAESVVGVWKRVVSEAVEFVSFEER